MSATLVFPSEFVITTSTNSGLTKDTKFDLVNRHRFPFDDKWFGPAPRFNPEHPKRGSLDIRKMEIKKKLVAAISVAEDLRGRQWSPGKS